MKWAVSIAMLLALAAAVSACASNQAARLGYIDHNNDLYYWEE